MIFTIAEHSFTKCFETVRNHCKYFSTSTCSQFWNHLLLHAIVISTSNKIVNHRKKMKFHYHLHYFTCNRRNLRLPAITRNSFLFILLWWNIPKVDMLQEQILSRNSRLLMDKILSINMHIHVCLQKDLREFSVESNNLNANTESD